MFNSSATLEELVAGIEDTLGDRTAFEVILVNDASTDDSWDAIAALSRADARVHGIDLARNFGQHNATLAGIRRARYDVIVTIDDDLQHPPEEIPALLAKLAEGHDVVYGTPADYRQPLSRVVASRFMRLALRQVVPSGMARHVTAFRAFRAEVATAFAQHRAPHVSIDALLAWGTARFAAVTVRHEPRSAGESNYTTFALVRYAFTMMTGFSARPLRLVSLVGFAFTLIGAAMLALVVVNRVLRGAAVPGFTFLAASLALFSGIQLFALGTIGEYLARMYERIIDRPTYVVRRATGPAGDESGAA